jgi:hypothetical protein
MSVLSYPLVVAATRPSIERNDCHDKREVLSRASRFGSRRFVHARMAKRAAASTTAAMLNAAISAATTQNPVPLLFDMAVSRSFAPEI